MTQREMILEHLRTVGSITSAEAMQQYGVYRLASRISELVKDGEPIRKETETMVNRFGNKVIFARYHYEKND